jgi:hypothetical protein
VIKSIYVIGSLRNPEVPKIAQAIRTRLDIEAFDDWHAAGPEADDHWQAYETARGRTYGEALRGHAAVNVFAFDRRHLDRCDAAVLVMPAGKSGHLEFGRAIGAGKRAYVLFDKTPERWDVMYQFADEVFFDLDAFLTALAGNQVELMR